MTNPESPHFSESTIVGLVADFLPGTEPRGQETITVWTFRIERVDPKGNPLPPIPVQMKARKFDGFVRNGDKVRIEARSWRPGQILEPKSFYNETTQSVVSRKGGCFIATAAFGDADSGYVQVLQTYRDRHLQKTVAGRIFISCYYRFSPVLAHWISRSGLARRMTRRVLVFICRTLVRDETTNSHP